MPVIVAREKMVETIDNFETAKTIKTAETIGAAKIGKNNKSGKYPITNLAQVPSI